MLLLFTDHPAAISAEAYGRMLAALLPPGRLWNLDPDSVLSRLLLACGDELERLGVRGQQLVDESDPRRANELLPDWERMLELSSEGTIDERRARVVALLVNRQRFRPVDFQTALAAPLGLAVEDVVVIENSRAHAIAVNDDREIYRFFVYRNPSMPGAYNVADAQALLDKMKPSHTEGHVIESVNFLCDDPYSLCDRDRLGV